MTSTTFPPHRYRCETCAHHIFHKGMKHPHFCDHPVAQNDGYFSLKFITLEEYERIQFMGCCSHSQHESAGQSITGFHNKETNEIFKDAGSMVLEAQKRYKELMNLTYCDIECVVKCPDEDTWYILDECGNWNYFPSDKYEIIFAETKDQSDAEQRITEDLLERIKEIGGYENCGPLWEMNSDECYSFNGNCTLCKVTKAIALLREGK